ETADFELRRRDCSERYFGKPGDLIVVADDGQVLRHADLQRAQLGKQSSRLPVPKAEDAVEIRLLRDRRVFGEFVAPPGRATNDRGGERGNIEEGERSLETVEDLVGGRRVAPAHEADASAALLDEMPHGGEPATHDIGGDV